MIRSFKHKGLRRLYEENDLRGVNPQHVVKLRLILGLLNEAVEPEAMNVIGLQLHPLKGDRKGKWSVSVNGNWRVIFAFEGTDAVQVELVDYH